MLNRKKLIEIPDLQNLKKYNNTNKITRNTLFTEVNLE